MENVTQIIQNLSGNPLSTPIGAKIEQATDPSLPSEDWNLNILICDMINDTDEDAVRAIRRRLQQNAGKNHVVIMYTLTVLETCVKNCGRRFHLLVTNKDFVNELIKLIGPKNEPPLILQTKVLSLIQTWAQVFGRQPELSGVLHVYNDLKSKSIEFPPNNLDCQVPIHTPQRSVPVNPPPNHISIYQHALNQNPASQINNSSNLAFQSARMNTPIILNDEQLLKLKSELEIVNGNIKVFDEMLTESDKSTNNLEPEDLELLNELNATCSQMQKRIVELLNRISNEEITSELLTINDNLNALFSRYEVYSVKMSQHQRQATANLNTVNQPIINNQTIVKPKPALAIANQEEPSLIDFKDTTKENQITDQLDALKLGAVGGQSINNKQLISSNNQQRTPSKQQQGDSDFDQFAQSRSTEKRIIDGVELPNEQEADEMMKFLGLKEQQQQHHQNTTDQPASLSNTEFDRFLEQRFSNLEKNQPPKKDDKNSGDLLDLN